MATDAGLRLDKLGHRFRIRRLTGTDRTPLQHMYDSFEPKRGAQGLPPGSPDQITKWLDSVLDVGAHAVVEIDGQILGHGMLLGFAPDAAELANFLHQSIRDRGIGTALNERLLDMARQQGLRRVWLSVEPSNRRAIRSYEKAGFHRRRVSVWSPEVEMEIEL